MVVPGRAFGQVPASPEAPIVMRFAAFTAITGYERAVVDTLLTLLPGATRDRGGSAVLVLGSGTPRRLVACPLDEPGWIVGGVQPDGYLTLRRIGRAPSPLFDQQLEGQRVTLFGRRGPVPGVVGVRSIHLARGRSGGADEPFTTDDARVDVGATSARQAGELGLGVLTPVSLTKRPQWYGGELIAAPFAGRRAACAALVLAARAATPGAGSVTVAFVTEHNLSDRGLQTVRHTLGPFSDEWVVDLAVRHAGTPVETVSLREVILLRQRMEQWIRGTP